MTIREFTLWRPSIYETVPEMCLWVWCVRELVEKRVGATVGVATGPTFVVLQDAPLLFAGISLVLVWSEGQADAIALSKRVNFAIDRSVYDDPVARHT
jgi:hypothetical protein